MSESFDTVMPMPDHYGERNTAAVDLAVLPMEQEKLRLLRATVAKDVAVSGAPAAHALESPTATGEPIPRPRAEDQFADWGSTGSESQVIAYSRP